MGGEELEEEPEEKAEDAVTVQMNRYDRTSLPEPSMDSLPEGYGYLADDVDDLFDTWHSVKARNSALTGYHEMKNSFHDLGISTIPQSLADVSAPIGWAAKAVDVMAVRSIFDGYVFAGSNDPTLDGLVRDNRLCSKYSMACESALVHGPAFVTVMRGTGMQPKAKVRVMSANQGVALWDKDEERVRCGMFVSDVDSSGNATRYVGMWPDAVLTFESHEGILTWNGNRLWTCSAEANPIGRPLFEPLVYGAGVDRPLGHSRITPEVMGIIDKAMRDVMNMEYGAAFFTFPQRYMLGVDPGIFAEDVIKEDDEDTDEDTDEDEGLVVRRYTRMQTYLGAIMALTRDESDNVPQVGQFASADAHNFTVMFENDAQRFSGATNVPLGQLGVLSNTYTSSDALGAANDPLILEVERMNRRHAESMEDVARLMLAVAQNVRVDRLDGTQANVQAYFRDPSMPTIAARADAWTKLGAADQSIVGTRVYYEGVGLSQATIDRLLAEKRQTSAISALNKLADGMGDVTPPPETHQGEQQPEEVAADVQP